MKTYVLTVSRNFPATHKRKGEPTFFVEKIFVSQNKIIPCDHCTWKNICDGKSCMAVSMGFGSKPHTIRSNYELWAKRIKEVQEGKAILSIRYWSGKPYNSKQIEFCQLDKDSGIGVQKIEFDDYLYSVLIDCKRHSFNYSQIAQNDGLSHGDFEDWFRKYDLSKPMAIIHFTKFRY